MKPFLAGSGRWSGKVACVDPRGASTRAPLTLPEPAGGFLGLSGRLPEDTFFLKAAFAPHPGRSEYRLVAFLTSIQSWAEAYPEAMQERGGMTPMAWRSRSRNCKGFSPSRTGWSIVSTYS